MLHEYKAKTHGDLFTSIRFLAIPIKPKEPYQYKHYIKVEDGFGMSTDGHRLHAADIDLPDGYYKPVKVMKTIVQIVRVDVDIDYPDPSTLPFTPPEEWATEDINSDFSLSHITFMVARNANVESVYNVKFLEALCGDVWTLHFNPKTGPLVAKNCKKTAIIMDMRR